jgi:hypothetical protein
MMNKSKKMTSKPVMKDGKVASYMAHTTVTINDQVYYPGDFFDLKAYEAQPFVERGTISLRER